MQGEATVLLTVAVAHVSVVPFTTASRKITQLDKEYMHVDAQA